MTKNGQAKTNHSKSATRIVHVAIPMPTFNRIRKIAKAEDRSINWKISMAIVEKFAEIK